MVSKGLLALAALAWLALSPAARGELRAVLIGVSDYADEVGIADLNGPANDVRLMAEVLERRGAARITELADGVEGGARPTRAAILAALAREAEEARPGDFVYIHLSGHGTRQPDREADETDGLDEVFLPADTDRAAPGTGVIPNAIVDDELGAALRAIRAKGADVWLVLDSCHSGTGTRALDAGATRNVDPAVLGITAEASPVVEEAIVAEAEEEDLPGGFIAFYAARSNELARELNMAPEGAEPQVYGLLSAKLAARLDTEAAPSFRQLFQAVLTDMNDTAIPGVARLQTPSWEGTLIDSRIFSGEGSEGVPRYAVQGDELKAGRVHGIPDGTLVALYADALDRPEAVLGYAQVVEGTATVAYLNPVDESCRPTLAADCPWSGQLPADARFAEVVARPVDMTVTLAPPIDIATGELLAADHPAMQALAAGLARSPDETGGYRLEMDAQDFEVETAWDGTSLWFGRRAVVGGRAVGMQWTPGTRELMPMLERMARAEALARMLGSLAGQDSVFNRNPVDLRTSYRPARAQDLAPQSGMMSPMRECRRAVGQVAGMAPVPLDAHADLKQCDQVFFEAQGLTAGARDVNKVHIDSQYCVHAEYVRIEGMAAAQRLGEEFTICSDCPNDLYSAGDERLFLVVSESVDNAESLNLEGLVETCAGGTRDATRGADHANEFFNSLTRNSNTRSVMTGIGVSNIWVSRHDWTVLPREEVFRRQQVVTASD